MNSRRKKKSTNTADLPIMEKFDALSTDGKKLVSGLMKLKSRNEWSGHEAVPPASLLEDVLDLFKDNSDIPLELPFSYMMAFLSGFLCTKRVSIQISKRQTIGPQLFLTALAPSGSSKTMSKSFITSWMKEASDGTCPVPTLPQPGSAAKFVEIVRDNPFGLWIRDEFGQFLNEIATQQHQSGMKEHLLNAYSNETLEKRTIKDEIVVEDYAFAFLGLTVDVDFPDKVGSDSLVDGFAQRFLYLIATTDKERGAREHSLYFSDDRETPERKKTEQRVIRKFRKIFEMANLEGANLTLSKEAYEKYDETFQTEFSEDFPTSFYRRIMFAIFRYAAIYHLLLNRRGTVIDEISVAYAARVINMHLRDTKKLLEMCGWSDLERMIRKCEEVRERFIKKNGTAPKARDYVSSVRAIQNVQQAKNIIQLMRPLDETIAEDTTRKIKMVGNATPQRRANSSSSSAALNPP